MYQKAEEICTYVTYNGDDLPVLWLENMKIRAGNFAVLPPLILTPSDGDKNDIEMAFGLTMALAMIGFEIDFESDYWTIKRKKRDFVLMPLIEIIPDEFGDRICH